MSESGTPHGEQFQPLVGMALVVAILVLAMANFMSVLDLTIVNVAIPHIAGSLAISPSEGTWAITSYAVAEAITVPLTGWLAARFGAVRVFVIAALGFGIFSTLCGLSSSLPFLVVFRVGQGLMGGPLMPMSQTLLLRVAPPKQRNLALGLWVMTTILAPVCGPLVSGVLSDSVGWPWTSTCRLPSCARRLRGAC
jgi:DHA2 family multidrug resistance protein